MVHDAKIGLGFASALTLVAFLSSCGQPAYAYDLIPASLAPEVSESIGDIITERTGALCASPVVFDYGPDWVVLCKADPTVWTLAASGNIYENGGIHVAIERNFR